ncbi:Modification methylase DpnIIA [termite gut metagenome]|uniref:Modification methylase DpnIIA n=1 Tax=termite gut metagenome TaxID=433724 RepID=A0A5J4RRT8_9ZZZZ
MRTPITYYGGKQNMLKHIRPLIPLHTLYCEPFCGGAAVFFDKEPVKVNVINDLNGELINFYRTIITHLEELRIEVNQTLHSRRQHEHAWYIYNNPFFFTNVQRAWAIFILSKLGFSGQLSRSFSFDRADGKRPLKMQRSKDFFCESLKNLLEQSTIECDDALSVIIRYDCEGAWFFLDPPYIEYNMGHYAGMFNKQNFIDLLEACVILKGKFMLTFYPNELIKKYAEENNWVIHRIESQVSACKAESRRRQEEWIICNYII